MILKTNIWDNKEASASSQHNYNQQLWKSSSHKQVHESKHLHSTVECSLNSVPTVLLLTANLKMGGGGGTIDIRKY